MRTCPICGVSTSKALEACAAVKQHRCNPRRLLKQQKEQEEEERRQRELSYDDMLAIGFEMIGEA